jgi:hypothetical protein
MIRPSDNQPTLVETKVVVAITCGSSAPLSAAYPDTESFSESRRTTTINYDFNRPAVFRQSDLR